MTQSGQGDEQRLPAARPAHEGVVLPADGSEPWIPGVSDPQVAPAGGQPWGEPWGPQQQPGQPGQGGQSAQGGYGDVPQSGYGAQGGYGPQAGYGEAPQSGYGAQAGYGPQAGYGAQGLPPQGPPAQALPPQAPVMGASDATQYIPPVTAAGPGALPPETPAESTQFLGTVPGAMPGPVSGPDAEATQFIAPVPPGSAPPAPNAAPFGIRPGAPGERQPPAEFDSLFRTDGPGAQPADATAQMPRFEGPLGGQRTRRQPAQQQYQQPQYQQPQGHEPEPGRRKSSHVPLIAAVVVGCAVLGLGVSAVMFGGGDDDKKDPGAGKNVAATSDAPKNSSEAAADPAKQQAEALDKLLADSNNSRATVIRSVENIKRCQNLDQASTDLHGAAVQRRGLVTRLEGLTVDKLPDNAALAASLTKAWEASAAADDHYAAWAKQVEGKKGCKDGKARNTGQAGQAARASGDATKAKRKRPDCGTPSPVSTSSRNGAATSCSGQPVGPRWPAG